MLQKINKIASGVKFLLARLKTPIPDFYGVFEKFNQVPDENPWKQRNWIDGNRAKLDSLQIGHFSDSSSGSVPDQSHILLPALVINSLLMETEGNLTVLDFGGGTGFSYFPINAYLREPDRVLWQVFDGNQELYEIGKDYVQHRRELNVADNIEFLDDFPEGQVDVVHSASTLEYIEDDIGLLTYLSKRYRPKYFVMTRIKGGNIVPFVTRQVVGGIGTPCRFSNVPDLISAFDILGYALVLHSPCESFEASQFDNIPERMQIHRSVDLILKRKD